jgi:pre-mRNA-processing factor 17
MTTSTKGSVPTGFADEVAISETTFRAAHRAAEHGAKAGQKRKREGKGSSSVVYGAGSYKGPWAKFRDPTPEESGSEEEVTDHSEEETQQLPAKMATDYLSSEAGENTEFHGESMYDYQGRTYMHVPLDLDIDLKYIY